MLVIYTQKLVRHVETKLSLRIQSLAKFKAVYEKKDQRGMGKQSKTEDCDQKRGKNNIPCRLRQASPFPPKLEVHKFRS